MHEKNDNGALHWLTVTPKLALYLCKGLIIRHFLFLKLYMIVP